MTFYIRLVRGKRAINKPRISTILYRSFGLLKRHRLDEEASAHTKTVKSSLLSSQHGTTGSPSTGRGVTLTKIDAPPCCMRRGFVASSGTYELSFKHGLSHASTLLLGHYEAIGHGGAALFVTIYGVA